MIRYIILIFIIIITYYKYCKDKDIEPFTVLNDYIPLWKDIDFKTECNNKMIDLKLKNFHIASAFKPYRKDNEISRDTLIDIINSGARCLYIDVTSSDPDDIYNNYAEPIIRDKNIIDDQFMKFKEFCKTCRDYAFKGIKYPLILYLNLDDSIIQNKFVQYNIATDIDYYFRNKFLGAKYSFSKVNVGDIPVIDALNKVVIITNKDTTYHKLQELTNSVIQPSFIYTPGMSETSVESEVIISDEERKKWNNSFSMCVMDEPKSKSSDGNILEINGVKLMKDYNFSVVFINYQSGNNNSYIYSTSYNKKKNYCKNNIEDNKLIYKNFNYCINNDISNYFCYCLNNNYDNRNKYLCFFRKKGFIQKRVIVYPKKEIKKKLKLNNYSMD